MQNRLLPLVAFAVLLASSNLSAATTAFTYQGQLKDNNTPLNGNFDFTFTLFDAATAGNKIGSTVSKSSVALTNGLFTVTLDFGTSVFDGTDRFLEITETSSGSGVAPATLSPRQQLTPVVYALQAFSVNDNAVTTTKIADGAVTDAKIASITSAGKVAVSALPATVAQTNVANNFTANQTLNGTTFGDGAGGTVGTVSTTGNLTVTNDVSAGGNVLVGNSGGDVNNTFRVDGFQDTLYIAAKSSNGAATGTTITFRTATAGGGEPDQVSILADGTLFANGQVTAGSLRVQGRLFSPVNSTQDITAGAPTISIPTTSYTVLLTASGGSVTTAVLSVGSIDGQEVVLFNNDGANNIQFDVPGTSNVADGASTTITHATAARFVWSSTANLWFHEK